MRQPPCAPVRWTRPSSATPNRPGTILPSAVTPLNGSASPCFSAVFERSAKLDCCAQPTAVAAPRSTTDHTVQRSIFCMGRPLLNIYGRMIHCAAMTITRRELGKLVLTAPAAALLPRELFAQARPKPNSKWAGVQVGLNVPYNYGQPDAQRRRNPGKNAATRGQRGRDAVAADRIGDGRSRCGGRGRPRRRGKDRRRESARLAAHDGSEVGRRGAQAV